MILIIGAGLSGLLTAYRLKKEGIAFRILEARNRVGGRIHTIYNPKEAAVEMGATWFTSQHQQLIALLEELDLEYFEQVMGASVFYQSSLDAPTQVVQIPTDAPSYRIAGGSSKLIDTLLLHLDPDDVLLHQEVQQITFQNNKVLVHASQVLEGDAVVLAIPPKLWANNILFEPALPNDLLQIATNTQTWMEDSIKVALTYAQPFWEQENLPATLFSNVGPITELYDQCNLQRSNYALCGFINPSFKQFSYPERKSAVLQQLEGIFGSRAKECIQYQECLWSQEKHTFATNKTFLYPHQNNGHPIFDKTLFDNQLLIASTEAAAKFPGYMDGAVHAANVTAEKIIQTLS